MTVVAELIYTRLSTEAGVTAIVGTRVYPQILPQGRKSDVLPAIVYSRASNTAQKGTSALRDTRYQIDCWAETPDGAIALAGAVKVAMEEWHDVDQSPQILWSRVINEIDDYEPDTDTYRVILDTILTTNGD